jgi:hypothetical protein
MTGNVEIKKIVLAADGGKKLGIVAKTFIKIARE